MDVIRFLDDLRRGGRLVRELPGYLRRPLTLDEARSILARRLESRDADFLDLLRRGVYANGTSPYLRLLRSAGCEYGDVENLVRTDGLERTLGTLRSKGVYLTIDEFKGRRPVDRNGTAFDVEPAALVNRLASSSMAVATSGSTGAATRIPLGMDSIRDRAVNTYLTLDAHGGAHWRHAVWGAPGLAPMLWYSACGGPADRWFSQVDAQSPGFARHKWRARLVRWGSRVARVSLPPLTYVPLDAPLPIARWMHETLARQHIPHLWASASAVVRLCRAARDAGVDVRGSKATVTGEPITSSRMDVIRAAGVSPLADYGSADSGGPMAFGCLHPDAPDDVHFFDDLHVVVDGGADGLYFSSLRATAPFVLLNVSMGDRAVVTQRQCGCPLEALGWRTHLHTIRSFEKLTLGGVTFVDTDVLRILDEVLPALFGGGPTDYQLIEEDAGLRLLVATSVGELDEGRVAATFLEALTAPSPTLRSIFAQWRDENILTVERRNPISTVSGKILHLRGGR